MRTSYIPTILSLVLAVSAAISRADEAMAADARDRIVVPGVRVGAITKSSTQVQLSRVYGAKNVRAVKVPVGEGHTVPGLMLFKGRKAELLIRFKEGTKTVELVDIRRAGSPWRTKNGIRIGTTAARIAKLNGRKFQLYGFGWDYAGRSAGWNRGRLSKNLVVDFGAKKKLSRGQMQSVLGDRKFWSTHRVMRRMQLFVTRMLVEIK